MEELDVGPCVMGERPGKQGECWEGLSPFEEVDG